MQARYTRLFTDESGASRFEDSTIELQQMFSPPGLETSIFSAPASAEDVIIFAVGLPANAPT